MFSTASQSKKYILYIFFRHAYSYSYCATNLHHRPIEIKIDFISKSEKLFFMPSAGTVTKVIQPGETDFLVHAIADPSADTFVKRCTISHTIL